MARLNVELKDQVYDEFQRRCSDEGRSLSEVVRSLVVGWLTRKRREEFQAAPVVVKDEEVKEDVG